MASREGFGSIVGVVMRARRFYAQPPNGIGPGGFRTMTCKKPETVTPIKAKCWPGNDFYFVFFVQPLERADKAYSTFIRRRTLQTPSA
jgi:hypothetical protein